MGLVARYQDEACFYFGETRNLAKAQRSRAMPLSCAGDAASAMSGAPGSPAAVVQPSSGRAMIRLPRRSLRDTKRPCAPIYASSRRARPVDRLPQTRATRSEEHTSELLSLTRTSYAVLCLITKKTNTHAQNPTPHIT